MPSRSPLGDAAFEHFWEGEIAFPKQRRPPDGDGSTADPGLDAAPRDRPERRRPWHVATIGAGRDDRAGERMFALGLDGCG